MIPQLSLSMHLLSVGWIEQNGQIADANGARQFFSSSMSFALCTILCTWGYTHIYYIRSTRGYCYIAVGGLLV